MSMTESCAFCEEVLGRPDGKFLSIYPKIAHRFVAKAGASFAIPTLGQLFAGSLLIVSNRHVERFAEATDLHEDVLRLVQIVSNPLKGFGELLFYEHGARHDHENGCGIYHAHMHVVPLPSRPDLQNLTRLEGRLTANLADSWGRAADGPDYLAAATTSESRLFTMRDGFGSQFMRKRLAEFYNLDRSWDWRTYTEIEPDLVRTLSHFGVV